jgi:hypothetical protein
MLIQITIAVNLAALAIAVWLGLYIVTRNPRSVIAWLVGLTLWSIASYFYNFLLALDPPPSTAMLPLWMQPFLLFWPRGAFEHGWGNWLKGWQIMPAIMLWHHITLLLRPEQMNPWRWIRVIFGYLVALVSIYFLRNTSLFFSSEVMEGEAIYLTTLAPGPYYSIFMGFLLLFIVLSAINLFRSARVAKTLLHKKQLELLLTATIVAGLTGPIGMISLKLDFLLPRVVLTILLGGAVFMIGYGVARYSALTDGRVIGREFFYSFTAVLVLAGLYFFVTWSSVIAYDVPMAVIATMMVLAIFTHSLVDVARQFFDLIFYRPQTRELREKLRNLIHKVYQPEDLEEFLSPALEALSKFIQATYGIILIFKGEKIKLVTSYHWRHALTDFHPKDLIADDVVNLPLGKFHPPLEEAALLIPLYVSEKQIGVLILGRPENSASFSLSDIERALDAGDRFADAIRDAERENIYLSRLVQEVDVYVPKLDLPTETQTNIVEEALRNLFDYMYLSDTPLAEMRLVRERLSGEKRTHLERGKAVQAIMLETIEQMKPSQETLRDPPPREWYPYVILHDAYVKEIQNRDVMSKLYISEGTFNRTRRGAIRSLARALDEMDASVK